MTEIEHNYDEHLSGIYTKTSKHAEKTHKDIQK
jgi:hypothetical protein